VTFWPRADMHLNAFDLHLERLHRSAQGPDDEALESPVDSSYGRRIDVHSGLLR
jgi:hypothetical protein